MTNQNPYESPQLSAVPLIAEDATWPRFHWRCINWTVAFSLNLVVPVVFGIIYTDNNAKIGAGAVFVTLYGLGMWICSSYPRFYKTITKTAYFLAITQLLPLLQMFCGILAHILVENLGYAAPQLKKTKPSDLATVIDVNGGMLFALFYVIPLVSTPLLAEFLSFLQSVPKRLFRK